VAKDGIYKCCDALGQVIIVIIFKFAAKEQIYKMVITGFFEETINFTLIL